MPASTADRPSLGEVDRHVAARLRRRRLELGLTLHQLAGLLGISAQQAHKYETRASLLPADRLAAAALGVGVDHFFEGLGRDGAAGPSPGQRQSLELARAFGRLSGPRRETLSAMVRALAKEPAPARAA
jgi:transcriptional regulator with XRE-family HTH domain